MNFGSNLKVGMGSKVRCRHQTLQAADGFGTFPGRIAIRGHFDY
jgi:hypothetical protein